MLRAILLVSEFGGLNSDFGFSLNQGNNTIRHVLQPTLGHLLSG